MIHDAYEGRFLNDRYKLLSRVGTGGMSVVYKAKDAVDEKLVAIKILKEEFCNDEEFIRKFNNEANAARSLSHPYIVDILDVGCDGDVHYIVMEFIEGVTLKDYIIAKHTIKWRDALNITAQILTALDHAHEHKIIHRDIKPQNIMLTPGGVVKLADFGIAKAVSSSTKSATPDSAGSVHYLSPEQARGGFVDERTDIYSTGIMMYEMVTGTVPFDGESHVSIALKHIDGKIIPPHEIDPGVPRGVSDLIVLATKKDPAMRFQSAKDMLLRLEKVINTPYSSFLNAVPTIHDVKPEPIGVVVPVAEEVYTSQTNVNSGKTEETDMTFVDDDDFFDDESEDDALEPSAAPVNMNTENTDSDYIDDEQNDEDIDDDAYEYSDEEAVHMEIRVRNIVFATITYAIAIVVAIVGIYFIYNRYQAAKDNLDQFVDTKTYIQDYTGMQVAAVESALAVFDIDVEKVLVESEEYPNGYIISQNVPKGTELTHNLKITFEVSSVAGSFVLDDYSSSKKDYKEIGAQLESMGAQVNYSSVYSSKVNDTLVVRTSPRAGTIIFPGDTITVYYSAGTMYSYVNVPDLSGMTLEEAADALKKIHLKLGVVFPEPGSIIEGLYTTPEIITPTPTVDPNATPEISESPDTSLDPDGTPDVSETPGEQTPGQETPGQETPDAGTPDVGQDPENTPEVPDVTPVVPGETPAEVITPGTDVTPSIEVTPGTDITPDINITPNVNVTPGIEGSFLPGYTPTPTPSLEPTPTPLTASLTVVGQYPAAYQTVLANETVHVYFYTDMTLLTQYKTVTIENPMMEGFESYYVYVEVETHKGAITYPLQSGQIIGTWQFPIQFNVPVSVHGEPTKVTVYLGANAITAQKYEIKYIYYADN